MIPQHVVVHRIDTHFTRLAKLLRPENDLEWMTAVAEDACIKYEAEHDSGIIFTDVNKSIEALSITWLELTLLEMDFVRAIDTRDTQAKQHLSEKRVRFREARVISCNGLSYQDTSHTLWRIQTRYVKHAPLRMFLPSPLPFDIYDIIYKLRCITFEDEPYATPDADTTAFIAKIDALLAEDDDAVSPNDEDWIPKAMPTG